ncbi:MAG: S41 family peptidase [Candidatus Harrisonbacteria bacterium]|nr:S41 family peptidase [Candidatus Harrisonbacteria bacterium]
METNKKRLILYYTGAVLAVILLLIGGYFIGFSQGAQQSQVFSIENVKNIDEEAQEADFRLFWEAWDKLKALHIRGNEISSQELLYGAVSGLAGAFDDPYTTFFPPEEAKKFEEDVKGRFGGIGAEIGLNKNGVLTIVAPLKDSPAEAAGLQAADLILEIDGESTQDINIDEAVSNIRGEEGSTVVLTIFREGFNETKEVSIIRAQIKVPTLEYKLVDDDRFAHIRLFSFNENAPQVFADALQQSLDDKTEGIILDLRNNPGGFLQIANSLAGWFLEDGQIVVTERFRVGKDQVFKAQGPGLFKNTPMVILINQGSASASEILAGALRDHNKVPLVGQTSFGKGTVQELVRLRGEASLKITIAEWEMPAGEILSEDGLTPDVEVEFSDEDLEAGIDTQLNKAIETLTGRL